MTPGDVPAVGALERAAYAFPWSEGIFRDCLRVGYLCRVADVEGAIVALRHRRDGRGRGAHPQSLRRATTCAAAASGGRC